LSRINQLNLRKKAAYLSLAVGIGMFITKMTAYYITGSVAIFSDAAESVVHFAATAMALFSIILSAKPADETHLYGHGNIEYFSAGVEGFLIVLAAGFINLVLCYYLIRTGKKTNSLTLIADGKNVLTVPLPALE
jgi:divalent metal cation (Fe/Co/Zn/Cd) transporter